MNALGTLHEVIMLINLFNKSVKYLLLCFIDEFGNAVVQGHKIV